MRKELMATYRVTDTCKECGGDMKTSSTMLFTNPPKFTAKCQGCHREVLTFNQSPRMEVVGSDGILEDTNGI